MKTKKAHLGCAKGSKKYYIFPKVGIKTASGIYNIIPYFRYNQMSSVFSASDVEAPVSSSFVYAAIIFCSSRALKSAVIG